MTGEQVRISDVAEEVHHWAPLERPSEAFTPRIVTDGTVADPIATLKKWETNLSVYRERRAPQRVRMWKIEECICYPPQMLLTTLDGRIIAESVRKASLQAPLIDEAPGVIEAEGALIVGSGQHNNFFHWMVEFAPKVEFARSKGIARFLLPGRTMSFADETFSPTEEVIRISKPKRLRNTFFIENLAWANNRLSPIIGDFYAEGRPSGHGSRNFVVGRGDARVRRLLNEDEFQQLGVDIVVGGGLSVADQAALFKESNALIGVHGANLTNMIFAPRGTKIFEILSENFGGGLSCYGALADLLGHDYTVVIGGGVPVPGETPENDNIILSSNTVRSIALSASEVGGRV